MSTMSTNTLKAIVNVSHLNRRSAAAPWEAAVRWRDRLSDMVAL
jgi:hypothetical protein